MRQTGQLYGYVRFSRECLIPRQFRPHKLGIFVQICRLEVSTVIAESDRMQKFLLPGAAGVAVLVIIAPLLAQAPAPATPSPTQAPARAPTPRPRATAPTQVIVRTNSGNPVEGVRVTLS